MRACFYLVRMPASRDREWLKLNLEPEFRYSAGIPVPVDKKPEWLLKIPVPVDKNRIGYLKFRFRLIRTGLGHTKSCEKPEFRFEAERFDFDFSDCENVKISTQRNLNLN